MKKIEHQYRKLVLVCTNEREEMECCQKKGSEALYQKLKLAIAARDPLVRVSKTRCLGQCLSGAIVVIMPDNVWLGSVTERDIDEIVDMVAGEDALDDLLNEF
jgi:sirohydrochlorin cobaltochelatase